MPAPSALFSFFLFSSALWLSGCGGVPVTQEVASALTSYIPGLPRFEMDAVPTWSNGGSLVRIYLQIPHKSLNYVKAGTEYRAPFEISARFRDPRSHELIKDATWDDTSAVSDYRSTEDYAPIELERSIALAPGEYLLEVALRDQNSAKTGITTIALTAFDVSQKRPILGKIVLRERKPGGAPRPLLGFQVQSSPDSLIADVEAFGLTPGQPSEFSVLVLRYHTDSAAALDPFAYNSFTALISQQMLEQGHPDTLLAALDTVEADSTHEVFRCDIPRALQGVYRTVCSLRCRPPNAVADTELQYTRYFSVDGPGFPRLSTIDEAVSAMGYINTFEERRLFLSIKDEARRRHMFDSLWLSFTNDPQKASLLIRKYYSRVEEANRYFSTTKEGWKTDQGMVYIVFGPPGTVEQELDTRTWYYDTGAENAQVAFQFKRIRVVAAGLVAENYVLLRSSGFEPVWNSMTYRWRTGHVY